MLLLAVAPLLFPQAATPRPSVVALDEASLEVAADGVALWLGSLAQATEAGVTWPVEAGRAVGPPSLYSGSPGVVLFFLEHGARRADDTSRALALAGARELAAYVDRAEAPQLGLYTGLAGIGFTLALAAEQTEDAGLAASAVRCLDRVLAAATVTNAGLRWNESTDIISGSAGIGLWLLDAAVRWNRSDTLEAAVRAGDDLLARAKPAAGGLAWSMDERFPRTMPNLSHGTAGVGLFLARLARVLRERDDPRAARFLAGAVGAGAHLRALATPQAAGGRLVHHSAPGNEALYYLGWCHGPTGTVQFLRALEEVSGDATWRALADELTLGLLSVGLPDARPPGYWDNVGTCCGATGIATFLARLAAARGEPMPALAMDLTRDVLARANRDGAGLSWTHCEHRARPDLRSTQTGLMQGAAGVGLWLMELASVFEGEPRRLTLPDDALGIE